MTSTTPDPSGTDEQEPGADLDPQDALDNPEESEDQPGDLDEVTDPSDPNFVAPFGSATRPAGG